MDQKIERKTCIALKQLDDQGAGLARIATLSAVDHDGDTYMPGAFGEQTTLIMPAHDLQAVPLGKARVFEEGDEALAEFQLNLDTALAREWHAALKFDLARTPAVQEWSYSFTILDAARETRAGESIRVLKRLVVHEISPVVVGAGIGTATLALKASASRQAAEAAAEAHAIAAEARAAAGRDVARAQEILSRRIRRR